jgi:antitoxin PrlF
MGTVDSEIITVTSNGQITIPRDLREQYGMKDGTRLMVVPTGDGLLLRPTELPTVDAFQERVAEREPEIELSMAAIDQLVHEGK